MSPASLRDDWDSCAAMHGVNVLLIRLIGSTIRSVVVSGSVVLCSLSNGTLCNVYEKVNPSSIIG